jgi:hypothetical protein
MLEDITYRFINATFEIADAFTVATLEHHEGALNFIQDRLNRELQYFNYNLPPQASDALIEQFIRVIFSRLRFRIRGRERTPPTEDIEERVEWATHNAPRFDVAPNGLRFAAAKANRDEVARAKAAVLQELKRLLALCDRAANEHPDLKERVEEYQARFRGLRSDRGIDRVWLAGNKIEALIRLKRSQPIDNDRNPPLGVDLLAGIQDFITVHAILVLKFPDIDRMIGDFDRYLQQQEAVDAIRAAPLNPMLQQLGATPGLLQQDTKASTRELADLTPEGLQPTKGEVATKIGWLRGLLGRVVQFFYEALKKTAGYVTGGTIGNAGYEIIKTSLPPSLANLGEAVILFFSQSKDLLLRLGKAIPTFFDYLVHFIERFF